MRSRLAMGGGPNEMLFSHSDISHAVHSIASGLDVTKWRYRFRFHAYMDDMLNLPNDTYVLALLTPEQLFDKLTLVNLRTVCAAHSISLAKVRVCRAVIADLFAAHKCEGGCEQLYTAFEKVPVLNKNMSEHKYLRYNGKR